MQCHLPELDLLVPGSPTVLLKFIGGLGMDARLSKVSRNFFNIAVIGNGVLPIVDLLLSSHEDTFIRLHISRHCTGRLL